VKSVIDDFVILRAKRLATGEYSILAQLPGNPNTPWVTWIADTVDGKNRRMGNYYYPDQMSTAYEEYEVRW
jgi:hypothetical protein